MFYLRNLSSEAYLCICLQFNSLVCRSKQITCIGKIVWSTIVLFVIGCVKEELYFLVLIVCVFMDDLSKKETIVNAGCITGSSLINNLMFADDLVSMPPRLRLFQCYT